MANTYRYVDVVGPEWEDGTTGKKATFNVQSLSADRTYTWPNAAGTVALTSSGNFLPLADSVYDIGSTLNRWQNLVLSDDSTIDFNFGSGVLPANKFSYTDAVGPGFYDRTQNLTLQFDIQSISANRTVTFPDAAGTVTLRGNTVTGTGSVVLATAPTLSNPVVGTQTAGDNSTKAASTAYADRFNGDPQFSTPTAGGTVSPTATGAQIQCFINPAGTLATLTLTLPTGTIKGQTLYATFTQIITALTVTGTNVDSKGKVAPTAAAVGDTFGWVWDSSSAKWNRIV